MDRQLMTAEFPLVTTLAALWVGSLFVYAGSVKLLSSQDDARRVIAGYKVLPAGSASIVARILPYAELGVGALILLVPGTRVGGLMALTLGVGFAIASISVLARGIKTSCGCAGGSSEPVTIVTTMRAVLIALAGLAVTAGNPLAGPPGGVVFGLALAPAALLTFRRVTRRYPARKAIATVRAEQLRSIDTAQLRGQ